MKSPELEIFPGDLVRVKHVYDYQLDTSYSWHKPPLQVGWVGVSMKYGCSVREDCSASYAEIWTHGKRYHTLRAVQLEVLSRAL